MISTPRTYLALPMSLISKTEDNHRLVALNSKSLLAGKMSLTYKVRNIIPTFVFLTYTQWSFETMVKPNAVMASWNLKYHALEDCLRPYMDFLR